MSVRIIRRRTIYQGRIIRLIRPSRGTRAAGRRRKCRGTQSIDHEELEADGRRITRDVIQHPGAVVIVPMLSRSRVLLVRQYRRAVDRTLLELPAGTLDRGERRLACARRELVEETGWRARRMRRIGRFYTAPGILSEELTVFLAEGLTHVGARPEPDEAITPVALSLKAALSRVSSGAICDAKTIIALFLAQRLLAAERMEYERLDALAAAERGQEKPVTKATKLDSHSPAGYDASKI